MNRIGLQLQQKHDLAMTAELREAIALLQCSSLDVQQLISQELADNPCLERTTNDDEWAEAADGRDEGDWDDTYAQVSEAGLDGPIGLSGGHAFDGDGGGWETTAHQAQTLTDYVWEQFSHMVKDATLRRVGRYVVDALDDAGYLRLDAALAAQQLGVMPDVVDDVRALVQTLEPVGIGARDLAECLRLQLHHADNLTPVAEICLAHLNKVGSRDLAALAKVARCSMQDVAETIMDIQACNPRPATAFTPPKVDSVVPDVLVKASGDGGWTVELNGLAFPTLLANPLPSVSGNHPAAKQARSYASERLGRAKWLMSALEQRADTILRVAKAIVAAQGQFLEAGPEFMVPLTLRTIAEQIGVHESTVSRVTTGKYMQTPRGTMEFKAFFASGVASVGGSVAVASTSVQAIIQRLVKDENPAKPLSDQALVTMLQAEGVEVARRTIAKYRGVLGIPGTAERKVRATRGAVSEQ